MSDIVELLHKAAGMSLTDPEWQRRTLYWKAADEIERLRAELESERERSDAMRAALGGIKDWVDRWTTPGHPAGSPGIGFV